jgi:hypothetical protein
VSRQTFPVLQGMAPSMAVKYIPCRIISQQGLRLCIYTLGACSRRNQERRAELPEKCEPFSATSSRYQIEGDFGSWGWGTSKRQAP